MTSARLRRDSTESRASLWEKTYEKIPDTKQDSPFGTDENDDALEETPPIDDSECYDSEPDEALQIPLDNYTSLPVSKRLSGSLSALHLNESLKPWENPTTQEYLKIIINNGEGTGKLKQRIEKDLSKEGLKWRSEEEEIRPWHFGLTSIRLHFRQSRTIDIRTLSSMTSIPLWLALKKEKRSSIPKNNISKKSTRQQYSVAFDVSLRYGAFTDLNQFHYSPQHPWANNQLMTDSKDSKWVIFLNDIQSGGYIEWVRENSKLRLKKQLLVTNINHCAVVDLSPNGFDIYIWQKCNMNESEANATMDENVRHRNKPPTNPPRDSRSFEQRPANHRARSQPRAPPPLRPIHHGNPQRRQMSYEHYRRVGTAAGCYFPTIQFSLHTAPLPFINDNTVNRIKQTLSLFIEFFLAHKITVCYGKICSQVGPDPYLFFQPTIPDFPSLIMKYSWQLLSSVGYRLQILINERFTQELRRLSKEPNNADELFYRVCVYLSRILALKPFIDINDELNHAITESKRKRSEAAYGLVSKIETDDENEAYIPSVTLTPTTIRIKPLKLCRTNRVLRAVEQFGKTLYHFVLVDMRDENDRPLASFHFHDLRSMLLGYLKKGFALMGDDRKYQYLHHAPSQLRARQFWFYHHDRKFLNASFSEGYHWMGDFTDELNPAKYAARMGQCFSTTTATIEVPVENVFEDTDISVTNEDTTYVFTDGCGTMSIALRNQIQRRLGKKEFSAVQFRYAGAKGVVSVDPRITDGIDLHLRKSMIKFRSNHQCFEVCKLSAPRPLHLNRQAILLLSYRKISDVTFLFLQQQNHLALIRSLLRNSDAEKLILDKIPRWLLPRDIHSANIDFIREPFFRQLLICSCSQSTRELLNKTRIRIPPNGGRNMIGIVDEYNVLKSHEVFIQFTKMGTDTNDNSSHNNKQRTEILHNRKVVITKNPCHHPGDIRTFTAMDYRQLRHLKDVIVFSQQGDRPAPHTISGSDLDGDEYLVLWNKDLVPDKTENAEPYDYDSQMPLRNDNRAVTRDDINNIVLEIAENDYLGRLSNLHLAFADKFGVDEYESHATDVMSTVELAGKISLEVDSGKSGYHPLNEDQIKKLKDALNNKRPDFMDDPNCEKYTSNHIIGKLFRASKRTLPGWNRLVGYHRHLRHLQVRTRGASDEVEEEVDGDDDTNVIPDQSIIAAGGGRQYAEYKEVAKDLALVYRQEIFEILNLYGLSHESDLWCRNLVNSITGELEDTAYTELEQLVNRTRTRFYNYLVSYCETGRCNEDTLFQELCGTCQNGRSSLAVACYSVCYDGDPTTEQAPILSLPWLFATPLLQHRLDEIPTSSEGIMSKAMGTTIFDLISKKRRLTLESSTLKFRSVETPLVGQAKVDDTVCAFIEILHQWLASKNYPHWPWILSRFVRNTPSFKLCSAQSRPSDEWEVILKSRKTNEDDEYAAILASLWTLEIDETMHNYFDDVLNICFDEGRKTNDIGFLEVSEDIILLLQKMAIKETIFEEKKHT